MVGYRKNRWTAEEEEALLAGIVKYGTGKWIDIVEDPQFSAQLFYRTNIDLKVYIYIYIEIPQNPFFVLLPLISILRFYLCG